MSDRWQRIKTRTKHAYINVKDQIFVKGSHNCAPSYRELGFKEGGVFIKAMSSFTDLN